MTQGVDRGIDPRALAISCRDGYVLGGHLWRDGNSGEGQGGEGVVIVNPATGVLARYYHRYARFLAAQGFTVITYDYRGVGLSRPARLRGCGHRWRDWGELDFDAVATWARGHYPGARLSVIGHSIGGFLVGYAEAAIHVDRFLTVGAQYAYWRDYAAGRRAALVLKWHLAMPAITAVLGYFPGRRLGWLEDLPAGVAHEWSFRGVRFETSYPAHEREAILARFAAIRAPILSIAMSDDEFATPEALDRALGYYRGADRARVVLRPADLGFEAVGHFGLFHDRHRDGFWRASCEWLRTGVNPWPTKCAGDQDFSEAGR